MEKIFLNQDQIKQNKAEIFEYKHMPVQLLSQHIYKPKNQSINLNKKSSTLFSDN